MSRSRRARAAFAFVAAWCVTLLTAAAALPAQRALAGRAAPVRAPAVTAEEIAWRARLLRMVDAQRLDLALVDSALASPLPSVRAQAALAAGQASGSDTTALAPAATSADSAAFARNAARNAAPNAAPNAARNARLRALLADADTGVAANAAFALGLVRDSAGVGALAAALARAAPVGAEAAWALGEIGAPARAAIESALGAPPPSVETRAHLLRAAAKLRPVPTARVVPFLAASEREVRWSATYAIARSRVRDGLPALLTLARDPDAGIRSLVASALARGATGDSLAGAATVALRSMVSDKDHLVRTAAIRSLASHGADQQGAVLGGFADRDPNVRVVAAQGAWQVLDALSAEWERLWADDTSYIVRRSLMESAMRAGAPLPGAAAWATAPDWRLRAASLGALAGSRDRDRRIIRARGALDDGDPRVRNAAASVLAADADSSAAARDVLRRRLPVEDDAVARATILVALGATPQPLEIALFRVAYVRAAADTQNDARLAALRALAASFKAHPASWSPAFADSLAQLPIPADPLERAVVRAVPAFARWAHVESLVRQLAYYDSVVRAVVVPSRAGRAPRARLVTERGTITVALFGADAPITVANFMELARRGYFNGSRFHRVVPNFVAQDGDPRGDGEGGPGYAIRDEFNRRRYDRGAVGMALSGPNTGGSQYFLTHAPQPHLDGHYTVFGHMTDGDAVLDRLVQGDRLVRVEVVP